MPQDHRPPRLLVSVRDAAEAEAALAGGAHLIDVKEPARGALGRADEATIAAVVERVAERRPVSAAMGELVLGGWPAAPPGLAYVKWGLAGHRHTADWQQQLRAMYPQNQRARRPGRAAAEGGPQVVPVAYADWEDAGSPPVREVCAFVRRWGSVLLLDTFAKSAGRTLLDCLAVREVIHLCRWCRAADVRVALAGSLRAAHIEQLLPAAPDWFGVRGAACAEGRRDAPLSTAKVLDLVELLAASVRTPAHRN
jgi:uncharacterized protein (UPF0264 family)